MTQSSAATVHLREGRPRSTAPIRRRHGRRRLTAVLMPVASIVLVLVIWQVLSALGVIRAQFFSSPVEVFAHGFVLIQTPGFWGNVGQTVFEYVIGFVAGVVVGVPLGVLMGWRTRLRQTLEPFLTSLYVSPSLVLLPVIVLMFGIGPGSKIAIVLLETLLMVSVNAMAGIRQTDPDLARAARSFAASDAKLFTAVLVPGALPSVLVGLRLAAGRAVTVVIVAELYGGVVGVGTLISGYGSSFQIPELLFLVGAVAIFGYLVTTALRVVESRVSATRGLNQ
jgi:ABC-type nitrate/sulfonate/bicarbonate transport system permease component